MAVGVRFEAPADLCLMRTHVHAHYIFVGEWNQRTMSANSRDTFHSSADRPAPLINAILTVFGTADILFNGTQ